MKIKIAFLTFVLLIVCIDINGQTKFESIRLDILLTLLTDNNRFMGSVTISKNGNVAYDKAFGYCDVASKKQAVVNSKYRIGSITKMFTSVMVFQLIEEKKLTLEQKLSDFYPEIPNAKQITISNLLNHRSGIQNFTDSAYLSYNTKPKTHKEILEILKATKPEFKPNEKAEYSNSNYVLLGYIIEKITKKDYSINLQERICLKAGLKNTYYGSKINNLSNECNSYTFNGSLWELSTETDMSIPHGAGAIVSSTKELNTFITALFNMKLISKTSLDEMTNTTDHYGKGIFPMPFYDNTSYGHTGGIDGFSSVLSYFPKDSISVAFCSNGMNYKMNDILLGVLNIYYGKAYSLPSFKTINLSIAQLTKYEGVYSKKDFPLKITIKVTDKQLTAQGTGQGAFPLEAVNENEFKFDAAGIIIIFSTDGKLNLKQGGGDIEMKMEE